MAIVGALPQIPDWSPERIAQERQRLLGGGHQTYTQFKQQPLTNTQQTNTQQTNTQQAGAPNFAGGVQQWLSNLVQGGMSPHTQALQQLIDNRPTRTATSWDEIVRRAQEQANLVFDPQVSALARALEQQRQATETQRSVIDASHAAGVGRTARLLENARVQALESAIARGGGRSGAVEWLADRLQTPVLERQQQQEAERIAQITGLAERLAMFENQAAAQQQELEAQRGQTAAQKAQALQEFEYAQQVGDWQRALAAQQELAGLAGQGTSQILDGLQTILPYVAQTVAQEEATRGDIVGTLGQTPTPQLQPIRQYVTQKFGQQHVGFDATRREVIIGNYRIPLASISAYGGEIRNGQVFLPAETIDRLMRR